MKSAQRRERQRAALRDEILAAARVIVVKEGYAALTMRRIAEAVEYSPAAIYQYFESRDRIAEAIGRAGFEELFAALATANEIAEPEKRLFEILRRYVHFGLDHPETYRLMFMEDPQITTAVLKDASVNDPGTRTYALLVGALSEMRAQGSLEATDAEIPQWADTVWTSVHGLVSLKLTCPGFPATPTNELLEKIIEMMAGGFRRRAAPSQS